jgi:predicted transcriptional regulator
MAGAASQPSRSIVHIHSRRCHERLLQCVGGQIRRLPPMSDPQPIQGDLQSQVMSVMWRLESATVEQVRSALPARYRGAYTTVQTVLNRLAERGLQTRQKSRHVIEYRPAISEADHVAQAIAHRLQTASSDARQTALARLIGDLSETELSRLRRLGRPHADG